MDNEKCTELVYAADIRCSQKVREALGKTVSKVMVAGGIYDIKLTKWRCEFNAGVEDIFCEIRFLFFPQEQRTIVYNNGVEAAVVNFLIDSMLTCGADPLMFSVSCILLTRRMQPSEDGEKGLQFKVSNVQEKDGIVTAEFEVVPGSYLDKSLKGEKV